jgi:tetratricopeptide (TPR) repeat protein
MKCLIGAGRFHDAVFLGEETVKIDPNSAQAYTVKAEAHKALGQTTQMQSALMTAMRINPNLASKFQSSLEYNSAPMPTALDIVEVK